MLLSDEHLRICQMMSGLTLSWPIRRMDRQSLANIEAGSNLGDTFLQGIEREILNHLRAVQQPEDREHIAQAYAAYAEATIYMLFKTKGIHLQRTPGTGGRGQKRPDFLHEHAKGDIYFEVKCLDFEGGDLRHRSIAYNALETISDLDARARNPGVYNAVLDISSFEPNASPADRIETMIKKIRGNAKMGQLRYGPCILVVDLGRLQPDAQHPSSLLPIYYNDGQPTTACASGELWHAALGVIGDTIYRIPEFDGHGNIDRPLKEEGILLEYPELLGISFVLPGLSKSAEIHSVWNVTPELSVLYTPCGLQEHEIGELISAYSDALNDDKNTFEYRYVRRP